MKILWMSDSPNTPSGFGNVTRFVCAGLAEYGHQVSILGWQAHGSPSRWQDCMLYPVRLNTFGADVLLNYLQKIRPDILVTLADVWWLTYIANPVIAGFMRTAGIPWALYYPIDGDMGEGRLPPSWVRILRTVDLPLAMSAYGRDVTRANGIASEYIPHGVDSKVFCPPEDKCAAKRQLDYKDKFVILSDARNQPRKLLPRTLEIFRRFVKGKADVILHLHCDPSDPAAQTPEYYYDLRADVGLLGLTDQVRFSTGMSIDTGLPLDQLASIYQAADVHLLASWGEGFGLPTLQAASTGVVPMAADYSASRELVRGHGEPIRVRHFLTDQFGLQRALIDVDDAVNRLEQLYRNRELLAIKSNAARGFAKAYDWDRIVPQWDEVLRRRMPDLHARVRQPLSATRLDLNQRDTNTPMNFARTVKSALPNLPDGARVTVNVVESKAGELALEVLRDAASFDHTLTIPVTLPPADTSLKSRVTGCVYLASERDVPVIQRLGKIFPGLNAWSTQSFELGVSLKTSQPVPVKVISSNSVDFLHHLAASTLALDLGGYDRNLPVFAAKLRVPCVSITTHSAQSWLWSALSLEHPDVERAVALGRWMLTDQGAAAELCEQAHRDLIVRSSIPKMEMR